MDPDAPKTVLKGVLATCSAGALFGAVYGAVKRQPLMAPVFTTSVNCGLAGVTFFAFREYVAGPILVETIPWQHYTRRREAIRAAGSGQAAPIATGLTFSDLRTHKLLDTAIAGSATGSVLYLFKRSTKGLLPSAITAGIICTMAQSLWNELEVTRIKFVSYVRRSKSETEPLRHPRTFSEKLIDGLGVIFPVRRLSDEEYMAKLLKQREEVERRLDEVRAELENMTERKNDR